MRSLHAACCGLKPINSNLFYRLPYVKDLNKKSQNRKNYKRNGLQAHSKKML